MILIKTKDYKLPSFDAINEFQNSFNNINIINEVITKTQRRILQKIIKYYPQLLKKIKLQQNYDDIFTILMAPHDIYKLYPTGFYSKRKHIYIYDLWEPEYVYFEKCIKYLDIDSIFFSSKQTKEYFENKLNSFNTKFYWLPEAITNDSYKFLSYDKKDIELLSFGRKYLDYHNLILDFTIKENINYIYQKDKIVFDTKDDFIDGLSRSKISICFPASITHKESVGNISKITMRYFQSMASKCLIIGHTPDDMKYIFDYNPIIEIDYTNPTKQIKEILYNYNDYIPLIEKNYNEVMNKHLYRHRANYIINVINNRDKNE